MAYVKDIPAILAERGLITKDQYQTLDIITSAKIVSVFHELRMLMYLGVMLFSTGAGMLIYQNMAGIGHSFVILALAGMVIGCFAYGLRFRAPFSTGEVKTPTPLFDYVILLGCLLLVTALGYAQFQFRIFSEQIELCALIAGVIYLVSAYLFDSRTILSLAITSLASFSGLTVSFQSWNGTQIFKPDDLHLVALMFGGITCLVASLLHRGHIKQHFSFTYINMGSWIFQIAALSQLFTGQYIYLMVLGGGCVFLVLWSLKLRSFALMFYAFMFAYIALSYVLIKGFLNLNFSANFVMFYTIYTIASGLGFVAFAKLFRNYFRDNP